MGQARSLLYAQVPEPGQEDERGWEWRYLWQQCQSQAEYQLAKEPGKIVTLGISHDARWVAFYSAADKAVSIWDLDTRKETKRSPS